MGEVSETKPTVLVVDDTPENIDILSGVLGTLYRVKAALNGQRALKIAAAGNRPDLILLDVMMPEMDGYEVCRRLKENEYTKDIPVIFVTAKSAIDDETKGFEHGAVDYIAKPISPPIVLARVKTHLQLRMTQLELENAREIAEEAARAKSDFLAKMSHEIRTPLNGLVANLEFLKLSQLDADQKQCIQSAEFCAETLLGIIGDILDLSKIEANKLDLDLQPTPLHETIKQVRAMMSHRAQEKDLNISLSLDPALPGVIRCDSLRLRQVLINLIGNAIKFTEEGGIHVRVARQKNEDNAMWLNVSIIDSGVGFNPDKASKLFEAFTQEDTSTTRVYGGTGLGLTICKRIMEMFGGWIQCRSIPGWGAVFEFGFPIEVVEEAKPEISHAFHKEEVALICGGANADEIRGALTDAGLVIQEHAAQDETLSGSACKACVVLSDDIEAGPWQDLVNALRPRPVFLLAQSLDPGDERLQHAAIRMGFADYQFGGFDSKRMLFALSEAVRVDSVDSETATKEDTTQSLIDAIRSHSPALPALVADDFPMNRQVACRQLDMLGIQTETAENGKDALEKATRNSYCLILTDCSMPIMDGFEFTKRFREWESGKEPSTPVIAMTANALQGDADQCIANGMDGYLSKPVTLERLAQTVARWLKISMAIEESPIRDSVLNAAPSVDLEQLKSILGEEDDAGLAEMLGYFVEDFDGLIAALGETIQSQDRNAIRDTAHKAKGGAANGAAMKLSDIMKDMQHGAMEASWEQMAEWHEKGKKEYESVKAFIESFQARAGS